MSVPSDNSSVVDQEWAKLSSQIVSEFENWLTLRGTSKPYLDAVVLAVQRRGRQADKFTGHVIFHQVLAAAFDLQSPAAGKPQRSMSINNFTAQSGSRNTSTSGGNLLGVTGNGNVFTDTLAQENRWLSGLSGTSGFPGPQDVPGDQGHTGLSALQRLNSFMGLPERKDTPEIIREFSPSQKEQISLFIAYLNSKSFKVNVSSSSRLTGQGGVGTRWLKATGI